MMNKVDKRGSTGGARVINLSKSFGGFRALPNLSFELNHGEFVTLLGPSGCGKTTALRCIAGLENADGGEIWIGDRLVEGASKLPPEKRNIGMVFQNYAIWPHMTVFDNLAYGLKIRKLAKSQIRERVMETLGMLGLGDLAHRYGTELSGGQQQRVAIGRCLVLDSDLFLFDEPLSNLDAKLRERLRYELKEIQLKFALTAIYVTHDQTEAMVLSDKVILMNKGAIVQEGPPKQLYQRPRSLFVANFFGDVNLVHGTTISVSGDTAIAQVKSIGDVQFNLAEPIEIGSKVMLATRPENVQVKRQPEQSRNGAFTATVDRATYLGHHTSIVARTADYTINADCPVATDFRPGEQVMLSVDADAWLHIKPDDAPASKSRSEIQSPN